MEEEDGALSSDVQVREYAEEVAFDAAAVRQQSVSLAHPAAEWPATLSECKDAVEGDIKWPLLGSSKSRRSCQWLMRHKRVLVRCVTWNMCGKQPPPVKEITRTVLPVNRLLHALCMNCHRRYYYHSSSSSSLIAIRRYHLIVVGTEECERSIALSAINSSKKIWEQCLREVVGDRYVALRSHTLQVCAILT